VIYRAVPHQRILHKLHRLPAPARDALVELLAAIVEDPYDALYSAPAGMDPQKRKAELGDAGFIEVDVDDTARTVTVTELVWID
jgi:mRNA-degrading endonuclease RelE of RelBE toxin-antitoxin system